MIDLLKEIKEITELNKCPKCGGSGEKTHKEFNRTKVFKYACPSCTDGFLVPELEKTEFIYVDNPESEAGVLFGRIPRNHKLKYGYVNPAYVIPAPTTDEVMGMLPKILNIREEDGRPFLMAWADEWKCGYMSWFVLEAEQATTPLLACLKLLRQYIEWRGEGKV